MRIAVTTILIALCLLACGASARERTVATALTATNASRDAFVAWDSAHQAALVAKATSLDDGRHLLEAYRRQRDPIVQGFAAVYRLIATAAIVSNDPAAVPALLQATAMLQAALKELGVSL